MLRLPSQSTGQARNLGMSLIQRIVRSRTTWTILGVALGGYFAVLVAVLGIVASAPRNFVLLRLNDDGDLERPDGAPLDDDEVQPYLAGLYEKARRATPGGTAAQVKTLVVITAPDELAYRHVWRLLHAGNQAGFSRWDLRRLGDEDMPDGPPVPDIEKLPRD